MNANIKVFVNFDRTEQDKNGRSIEIWRKRTCYLSKDEVIKARENKENLKVTA